MSAGKASTILRSAGGTRGSGTMSAGGTGLSGSSRQRFTTVAPLTLDESKRVVVTLRLVCQGDKELPTPMPGRMSTPVPAPVE